MAGGGTNHPFGQAVRNQAAGRTTGGNVAVTSGAGGTLIRPANPDRMALLLRNAGSQTVYLYPTDSVSSTVGMPLLASESFEDRDGIDAWYARAASGTGDIRWLETSAQP